jgi:hypothetical protein
MAAATAKADSVTAVLNKLLIEVGIDLTALPPVATAEQLAPVVGSTVGSLANDRYRRVGIPYVKHGSRVRYLRADVARYLLANRHD